MHTRTIPAAVAAAVCLLALTGCGASEPDADKPAPEGSPSASATATLSAEEAALKCTAAITKGGETATDGELPMDPRPTACEGLSEDAFLEAYMAAVRASNQKNRDELQRQIDEAAEEDAMP